MPHFIIECSENVLTMKSAKKIMACIYDEAEASAFFARNDIKVRIRPFSLYQLGEKKEHFLHVFAHIMEGRTMEQRAELSKRITGALNKLLPELSILSMNIYEFEKSTYCNKGLLDPNNKKGDRHFGL